MTFQILDDKGKPLSHGQQMANFMAMTGPYNLQTIDKTQPNYRMSLVSISRMITLGMQHLAIKADLTEVAEGRANVYLGTPEAIQFWKDHADKTPDEVWDLWVQAHPVKPRVGP